MAYAEQIPVAASHEEAKLYWIVSAVILWIGALGVAFVIRDMRTNTMYRQTTFKGFFPLMIADLVWLIVYLPYHTYNAIGSVIDDDFGIDENRAICVADGVGAIIGVAMNLFGLFVIAFALRTTVRKVLVKKMDMMREVITNSFLIKGYAIAVGLGVFLAVIDVENIDSYRGLYCFFATWNLKVGFTIVAYIVGTMNVIFYYFADTYFILKRHIFKNEGTMMGNFDKDLLKLIATLTMKFFVVFLFFWTPSLISIMMGMAKVKVPIQWDMFSGIMMKIRIIVDVVLLLSLPGFRNRTGNTTKAKTKVSTGNDNGSSHKNNSSLAAVSEDDL